MAIIIIIFLTEMEKKFQGYYSSQPGVQRKILFQQ